MARGDAVELASRVAERFAEHGAPLAFDVGQVWHYEDGVWHELHEDDLINAIGDMAGCEVTHKIVEGVPVYRKLKINSFASTTRAILALPRRWGQGTGFFDDAPWGVAFTDAFVEVMRLSDGSVHLKVREPGPEHKARARYEFAHDLQAQCPRFQKYLDDIWCDCEDRRERELLLQEFAGACLFGLATRYHKALILQGSAGTGKSTMIRIIESLMPEGTVCNVGPADFDDDDKLGMLIGAKLNTLTEASGAAIFSQDRVKSIMEGEWQTIVRKWEKAARFKPVAGHLFAVNTWPAVPGAHASYWDRWLAIDLQRRRRGGDGEIKDLAGLIAKEERAGLVAWAIEGARRLLEQDGYTRAPSSDALLDRWKADADALGFWMDTCVQEINGVNWQKASALFKEFDRWSTTNGFKRMNQKTFSERLVEHGVQKKVSNGVQYRMSLIPEGLW